MNDTSGMTVEQLVERFQRLSLEASSSELHRRLRIKATRDFQTLIRNEKLELLKRIHHEYYEVDEETLDTIIQNERTKLTANSEGEE